MKNTLFALGFTKKGNADEVAPALAIAEQLQVDKKGSIVHSPVFSPHLTELDVCIFFSLS
jgi:hypothetical protein